MRQNAVVSKWHSLFQTNRRSDGIQPCQPPQEIRPKKRAYSPSLSLNNPQEIRPYFRGGTWHLGGVDPQLAESSVTQRPGKS